MLSCLIQSWIESFRGFGTSKKWILHLHILHRINKFGFNKCRIKIAVRATMGLPETTENQAHLNTGLLLCLNRSQLQLRLLPLRV